MINRKQREKDILKLIEGLDIPQSLYVKAIEHYNAVAAFLHEQGIESDIYPQGSYSLGTVVRPYKESEDAAYDLDAVCEININKSDTTAEEIKKMVGDALKSDGTYRKMLQEEWDKCWTLEYADVNGIGFSVDIVPAVAENDIILKNTLVTEGVDFSVYDSQIAITHKDGEKYTWKTSNPKAYQNWFKELNESFVKAERQRLAKRRDGRLYVLNEGTVEKIPEIQERSALQRVIQIVKYHADVYYTKGNIKEYKSASVIVTTLIALLAQEADPSLEVFPLLSYIVGQLEIYGENLSLTESAFSKRYENKNVIRRIGGQWVLRNPLNPSENLVDSWNQEPCKAQYFFQWIRMLKKDYLTSLDTEDEKFVAVLENNFGKDYLQKSLNMGVYARKEPANINVASKPYRR
ncbi:hypothetical protein GN277_28795 (plasmid) [Lachnospiraceae bacterium WCA-9-b2]|uniref:Cyclic GMP-AMP synthase n=1 Tax=Sporofaciens musculi TaxID=2681861 RepID=A0A7X3MMM0_9FIRM|nr:nucleotidyltransferase [Sporofaciens musculi]MXP79154.1 hypothetical protein [Sporofaciens musculi]NBJ02388.1 nucleotidyltransferase [Lachnospiraceae bacterium]